MEPYRQQYTIVRRWTNGHDVKSWRRAAVSLGRIADGSWFVESTEHRQARAYPSREVAEQIARQVMAASRWDTWTEIPPDQPPPALG